MTAAALLATTTAGGGVGPVTFVVATGLLLLTLAGLWGTFVKAGQPGWAAIIPIYNVYVLLKVAGRPGWWLLLFLVPLVNVVVQFIVVLDVAKSFGKGVGYAIGLYFLPFVFYPLLAFGEDDYRGPAAA